MAVLNYQPYLDKLNRFRKDQPLSFLAISIAIGFFAYYLIVLAPLGIVVDNARDNVKSKRSEFEWMAKASQEILRLKKLSLHERREIKESPFTFINQQINDNAWSGIVTDVRQMDEHNVQISFDSISYAVLANWLQTIYQSSGVFVSEATIERIDPGVVKAMLVLSTREMTKTKTSS